MSVTIIDIAKIAGVAKSTVSRYLNNGYVSEKTRSKIERAIQDTNFQPNAFAQSLKAHKTNLIGVIIPRLNSFAMSKTLMGIDDVLKQYNYQMLIVNTNQQVEEEIQQIYNLAKQKVAGIIVLAAVITEEHKEAVSSVGIPVLFIGQEDESQYCIVHNDYQAGYDVGEYVVEMGHKEVAYLGVPQYDIAVGVKRKRGFQEAIEHTDAKVYYYETTFAIESAKETVRIIFQEVKPTIIACATDNIALGVLKVAHELGKKVPEEISIIGFGGYDVTEIVTPSLTTVSYDYVQAGKLGAEKIHQLVSGENVEKKEIINTSLFCRESVYKVK